MANNRLLDNQLREKWTKFIFDMLTENGEDVGYIKDNVINFPTLDSDGNEKDIEITIKVPKGSTKDNEPYDLSLEVYEEDVINQCFENFCKGKEGYVFNQRQLNKVLEKIGSIPCSHYEKDSIFYVKKV